MRGENPANDILINTYIEGQCDLLGYTRTSPHGITLLHIGNGTDDILVRTFWSGFDRRFGENSNRYFR